MRATGYHVCMLTGAVAAKHHIKNNIWLGLVSCLYLFLNYELFDDKDALFIYIFKIRFY